MTALAISTPYAVPPRLKDPAQALWTELRFADAPVDELDLLVGAVRHCEEARPTRGETFKLLEKLLGRWVGARLVAVEPGRPPRYSLERNYVRMASPPALPAPARVNPLPRQTQRQRLWSAARVLRNFDLTTLLIAAEAKPIAARQMLSILERGGWLRRTATGWSTAASRRWGPVAPSWAPIDAPEGRFIRVTDNRDGSIIDLPVRRHRRPRRQDISSQAALGGGVG